MTRKDICNFLIRLFLISTTRARCRNSASPTSSASSFQRECSSLNIGTVPIATRDFSLSKENDERDYYEQRKSQMRPVQDDTQQAVKRPCRVLHGAVPAKMGDGQDEACPRNACLEKACEDAGLIAERTNHPLFFMLK